MLTRPTSRWLLVGVGLLIAVVAMGCGRGGPGATEHTATRGSVAGADGPKIGSITVVPGDQQAILRFTAPGSDGARLRHYAVSTNGGLPVEVQAASTGLVTITVPHLVNGNSYQFAVAACGPSGESCGPATTTDPVMPSADGDAVGAAADATTTTILPHAPLAVTPTTRASVVTTVPVEKVGIVHGCNTYGENCEGNPIFRGPPPTSYEDFTTGHTKIETVPNGTRLFARCWNTGTVAWNYAALHDPVDYGPDPYDSTVYFQVKASNGEWGYIADTYFVRDKTGKMGLPHC
jgi:hypothetical protein